MVVSLAVVGLFFSSVQSVSADATSCTNSGGTYNASGFGTCNCPSGTAVNDVCPTGSVTNPPGQVQNPGPQTSGTLTNPLKSASIQEFLLKIIDVLLVFALPIIILYIMYSGYLFVTAAGNSEKIAGAKNALLWSVIGGVIILGARLIISVIQGTVTAF